MLAMAVAAVLIVAGPAGAVSTRYEQRAALAAIDARQAGAELASLRATGSSDRQAIGAAAARLESAAGAACTLMRTYRGATTRYGNATEILAVRSMLTDLRAGRAHLSAVTGVAAPAPSVGQRARARTAVRQALTRSLLADLVQRRLQDVGLANALRAGDLSRTKHRIGASLVRRLRATGQLSPIVAEVAEGLALGAPLKQQARVQVRLAASRLLGRLAVKVNVNVAIVQLAGNKTLSLLRRAFRGLTGPGLSKRTRTSLRSLNLHLTTLRNTSAVDTNIGVVRRRIARAERALAAARFLRRDLARAGRRALLRSHRAAETRLRARIRLVRNRFLLGSALVANVEALAKDACDLAAQIRKMRERYEAAPQTTWSGKWARVEHAGTLTLVQTGSTANGSYDWFGGGTLSGSLSEGGARLSGTFAGGPPTCASGSFNVSLAGRSFAGTFTCAGGASGPFGGICTEGACLTNAVATATALESWAAVAGRSTPATR